jgi:anti-anti-sigma factor
MRPELGQVVTARRDGTSIFCLEGEFDLSNAWKIEDTLLEVIKRDGDDVVVDLSAVRFMDAQLVRVLVHARDAADARESGFVVVPPADPDVWRVARLGAFPLAA